MSFSWLCTIWASCGISCSFGKYIVAFEAGLACIAEQLLGLLHITLALRLRGVEERVDRGDRVIVADVGLALEHGVDQCLAVDAECDGLAHPLVGEVALTAVHPDLTVRRTADATERRCCCR